MRKIRIICLILLLAFFLCACGDPGNMSKEELYSEINGMLEHREIIPEDYLNCLDEEVANRLIAYNECTGELLAYYRDYGLSIARNYDLWLMLFGDAARPAEKETWHDRTFSSRLSQACLYPDAPQRVQKDWYLSGFARFDSGGSYGLWASLMHTDFYVGSEQAEKVRSYFQLIDELTQVLCGRNEG